jgi:hypothetical protein
VSIRIARLPRSVSISTYNESPHVDASPLFHTSLSTKVVTLTESHAFTLVHHKRALSQFVQKHRIRGKNKIQKTLLLNLSQSFAYGASYVDSRFDDDVDHAMLLEQR